LKPTDPCGSVWVGSGRFGLTGPGGSFVRFWKYKWVGSGCPYVTHAYPNPNRDMLYYFNCIILML
jgi:hypothetical protein